MDQLDILKSKWQSQKSDFPQYSKVQLTALLAKNSSSIVKWIFYIGIAEFVLLTLINIFYMDGENVQPFITAIGEPLYYGSYVFSYAVVLFFIYRFWSNYKNISAAQPARQLMKNILKTRRTMKWYIWYNIVFVMLFGLIYSYMALFNAPEFSKIIESAEFQQHTFKSVAIFMAFMALAFAVFCGFLYGVYSLIYGILLRRLKRNYEELRRMEV